jgi:hypothetical protein
MPEVNKSSFLLSDPLINLMIFRDFQKIKYAMGNNDNHFKGGE